jgi:hypothetical protein
VLLTKTRLTELLMDDDQRRSCSFVAILAVLRARL